MKKVLLIMILVLVSTFIDAQNTAMKDLPSLTSMSDTTLFAVQVDSLGFYSFRKMTWEQFKEIIADTVYTWMQSDTTLNISQSGNEVKIEVKVQGLETNKLKNGDKGDVSISNGVITIDAGAVSNTDLAGYIESTKFASGDKGDVTFTSGVITIDAGAVTNTHLAGNIGSSKFADGDKGDVTFTSGAITINGDIPTSKLADGDKGAFTLSSGVATLNVNKADSTVIADGHVQLYHLKNGDYGEITKTSSGFTIDPGVIGTLEIAAGAVNNSDIAALAVDSPKVANNNIPTTKLLDGDKGDVSISSGVITVDADVIDSVKIKDGDVQGYHMADSTITSEKITGIEFMTDSHKLSKDDPFYVSNYIENLHLKRNKITGNNSSTHGLTLTNMSITSAVDSSNEIYHVGDGIYKRNLIFNNTSSSRYWRKSIAVTGTETNIKFGFWVHKDSLQALVNDMTTGRIELWMYINSYSHIGYLTVSGMTKMLSNDWRTYRYNSESTGGGVTVNKTVYCAQKTDNWLYIIYDCEILSGTISSLYVYFMAINDATAFYNHPQTIMNPTVLFDEDFISGFLIYNDGTNVTFNNVVSKNYVDSVSGFRVPDTYEKIRVQKSGTYIYIRSYFNESYDVVLKYNDNSTSASANGLFRPYVAYRIGKSANDLISTYELGTIIHSGSDDHAPFNTDNIGYVGGGHGFNQPVVTSATHNKDTSDIGSLWTDGTYNFWIAEISGDDITLLSQEYADGDSWKMRTSVNGTLTHVSGATHTDDITVNSQSAVQQYPSVKNTTTNYLIDGSRVLEEDVIYYCDFIDVVEQYDLVDPSTLTAVYPMDWGNGESWLTNYTTWRFGNFGSIVMYYGIHLNRSIDLGYFGAIQSVRANQGSFAQLWYYMPKVDSVSDGVKYWKLKNIESFNSFPATTLDYTNSYIEDTSNAPDRLLEFLGNNDTTLSIGYAHGYNTFYGDGKSSARDTNVIGTTWQIYTNGKSYPRFVGGNGKIDSLTNYNIVTYRQYYAPTYADTNATSCYYYNVRGDLFVYADYHSSFDFTSVKIPSKYSGFNVEVVEKSSSVSVHNDFVVADRINLSVTEGYGYVVLRIH